MNEYITDEAVEKAASAMHDHGVLAVPCESGERACLECGYAFGWFGVNESEERQRYNEHRARAALEAAAPLIAAKALEAARGPYRCCPHCADDLIHNVEKDDHTVPCQLCQNDEINRAAPLIAAKALRDAAEAFGENQMIREGVVKEWLRAKADRVEARSDDE